jgi:hypothetical protein
MTYEKIEPVVWKPINDGDTIEGFLIHIDTDSGKYKSKIYHIETIGNKEQKVVFGTTVLDDKMKCIVIGDRIKIIFKGTTKNEKKQDVKIYEVYKWKDPLSI